MTLAIKWDLLERTTLLLQFTTSDRLCKVTCGSLSSDVGRLKPNHWSKTVPNTQYRGLPTLPQCHNFPTLDRVCDFPCFSGEENASNATCTDMEEQSYPPSPLQCGRRTCTERSGIPSESDGTDATRTDDATSPSLALLSRAGERGWGSRRTERRTDGRATGGRTLFGAGAKCMNRGFHTTPSNELRFVQLIQI